MRVKITHKKQAFTLVEITIVIGIILLVAALSIHSLLRARISSNDAAAQVNIKAIATAEEAYKVSTAVYTNDLIALVSDRPPYLSNAFTDSIHQGYNFYIIGASQNAYVLYAQPQQYGVTGTKFIVCDSSGIRVFDRYGHATAVVLNQMPNYGIETYTIPEAPVGYLGE